MKDLDETLKLIAKHAPDLRKAGVTAVSIGDIDLELAAPDPEPQAAATTNTTTHRDDPDDPFEDPATFGGRVPRRRGEPPPNRDGMSDGERR
jgi:hypothetical protein